MRSGRAAPLARRVAAGLALAALAAHAAVGARDAWRAVRAGFPLETLLAPAERKIERSLPEETRRLWRALERHVPEGGVAVALVPAGPRAERDYGGYLLVRHLAYPRTLRAALVEPDGTDERPQELARVRALWPAWAPEVLWVDFAGFVDAERFPAAREFDPGPAGAGGEPGFRLFVEGRPDAGRATPGDGGG